MPREYRSSIPKAAAERVVIRYPNGATRMAEYLVAEEVLGVRYFHETGEPEFEFALKKGKRHGVEYRWDLPGKLTSAEAFVDGIPHGTARQWSQRGELIGTYTMNHGTGIDLWWQERGDGSVYLAEVLYWK